MEKRKTSDGMVDGHIVDTENGTVWYRTNYKELENIPISEEDKEFIVEDVERGKKSAVVWDKKFDTILICPGSCIYCSGTTYIVMGESVCVNCGDLGPTG